MTFLVLPADGSLVVDPRPAGLGVVDEFVGPEGHNRIRLNPGYRAAAWANDCGLLFPERYPRNIVGSCVLATLHAPQQPYAGALVITGYDYTEPQGGWPEDCPDPLVTAVSNIHAAVQQVLAGQQPPVPWATPGWSREIRELAAVVADRPVHDLWPPAADPKPAQQ